MWLLDWRTPHGPESILDWPLRESRYLVLRLAYSHRFCLTVFTFRLQWWDEATLLTAIDGWIDLSNR